MKLSNEMIIRKEVELTTLVVKAPVRYWEDTDVDGVEDVQGELIPCKADGNWCPVIDLDKGVITNWKAGVTANVHYKVCDEGSYYLKDADGNTIFSIEEDYVPEIMCPKENGYGDYIIMDIGEDGSIANWKPSLRGFETDGGI